MTNQKSPLEAHTVYGWEDVTEVKAPANAKIAGEHSVVYGGPSLSAAIDIYATARVEDTGSDKLEIVLEDMDISRHFNADELNEMYSDYKARNTANSNDLLKYIEKYGNMEKELLPYATIASRLFAGNGIDLLNKKVTIRSDVPMQKGYASSAACSTAFAIALIKASGKKIDDQIAIDIARDGERIVHKAETAGRIDVGPAYFGGYTTFSAPSNIKKEDISTKINLVVVDTGPKPPTSETVGRVRALYERDTEGTTKILRNIDECVLQCIESLKSNNLKELGKQMSLNHELLKKLGVSSEGLDKAVSIALSEGAYGAKLCGGGGGGMCIALVEDQESAKKIIDSLKKNGFEAFGANVSLHGAKSDIN